MQLKNQTILITGGGSGIGLGLAVAFKRLGNTVIVSGRSKEKLKAASELGLETISVDMKDEASIQTLAQEVVEGYPSLNCLIHGAGIMQNEKVTRGNTADIAADTIATNLLGPILLTNALLPHLLKQKSATIVTVTSGLAFLPIAIAPTYCATKAALHSYTESLRYQLRDTSVEVKELAPPYVRTSLMGDRQANDPRAMPLDEYIEEVMEILKANPKAEEILVKNVIPFREAAFHGGEQYQKLFKERNDAIFSARKEEWELL